MFELDEVKKHLASGKTLEDFLKSFDWKGFESSIAEIFRQNDFKIKNNFRFKGEKRYEIDIIAVRGINIFCIDCKEWSMGRHKGAALKNAVIKQEIRAEEFAKFLKVNPIAKAALGVKGEFNIIPLIVTLYDEVLQKHSSTFIVSVPKLNAFINEFESVV